MIVCHRYRFIFVTTRKTCGTPIEIALSAFCADDDVITGIARANGASGAQLGFGALRRNDSIALAQYRPFDWLRLMVRGERARLDKHVPAGAIRALVGETIWNGYFKFCVERDPWEKAVALYDQRTRALNPRPSIAEFLAQARPESLSNFPIYTIDGALAVDRVIRFEHLDAELDAVGHLLNLPTPLTLPDTDRAASAGHYSARIGPAERALVDAACVREIEMFGYGFREVAPEDR
jgi:hypothetical protein